MVWPGTTEPPLAGRVTASVCIAGGADDDAPALAAGPGSGMKNHPSVCSCAPAPPAAAPPVAAPPVAAPSSLTEFAAPAPPSPIGSSTSSCAAHHAASLPTATSHSQAAARSASPRCDRSAKWHRPAENEQPSSVTDVASACALRHESERAKGADADADGCWPACGRVRPSPSGTEKLWRSVLDDVRDDSGSLARLADIGDGGGYIDPLRLRGSSSASLTERRTCPPTTHKSALVPRGCSAAALRSRPPTKACSSDGGKLVSPCSSAHATTTSVSSC
eukprot:4114187-Pleurochrysis_carterae.AAC.1